ncbi:ABC transporter permease [Actinophytocola gossypii]|uniref:ABC transporter permease subunit n=1 Tax=Actinophytocola gossypii TaxID=2812003 RepID=A0ABT2JEJ7_9PSEU|nr:ABC transporter permease [Actinophytocola gossypii]MCT2586313.1 ABC transporter permease subunit [Actinophytocola gossypii]
MGRLIKAEFLKILTTKLWWALAIPAVLLALAWAWGVSAFVTDIADDVADSDLLDAANIQVTDMSWSVLALTRAMNIATLFPMVFGALALASELSRKTITTTFLTAASRGSVLGAKAITYVAWGAIYGLVVAGAASLGTVLGSNSDYLPEGGDWFLVLVAGVIACVLWTLLGMGVGALLGSPVGTLVILLIYAGFVGPVSELILFGVTEGSHLTGWLPNGSANGLTGATASEVLFGQVQDIVGNNAVLAQADVEDFDMAVRFAAGAPGAYSLWVSGLIFLGWTMLFFVTGLFRNRSRDIT